MRRTCAGRFRRSRPPFSLTLEPVRLPERSLIRMVKLQAETVTLVDRLTAHAVLGAAEARGEQAIILLGSPAYYSRFGFRLAAEFGITPPVPEWDPHFQARLFGEVPAGAFRYAEPFNRL